MSEITAGDIDWVGRGALPRRDRIPARLLECLSHDDLLAFAEDVQDDNAVLRVTLQETIHTLASVTSQRDRLRHAIRSHRT